MDDRNRPFRPGSGNSGRVRSSVAATEQAPTCRPIDGFMVGGATDFTSADNVFVLVSRPGFRLTDFFLNDDPADGSVDPVPFVASLHNGLVEIREIDWEHDRFFSEVLGDSETSNPE